ncbi:phosphoglycerate dehydrogenase [Neobacillus sp. D3-1R]|uniref:phosphoglycerate dehydrogenase n=1 Tax=Neobacillus sp. D3-1R TaxID=3445778 RepID=UPI003F9F7302
MFRILVADSISKEGLYPLQEENELEIIESNIDNPLIPLNKIDALLVRSSTMVNEELMQQMPNLKIIARAGVGVDNIDVPAATRKGIIVVNAPDGNTISTAEHTFAMMASMLRNIPQANQSLKIMKWERNRFIGNELFGKQLGIIGFGRIGTEIAKRAKAFGMSITVFDPFLSKTKADTLGIHSTDLNNLLSSSDIITVHTPLTSDTKYLLNDKTLALTKKGVYLINCARGGIIEEKALLKYVENGHISGVALDVFENEPPGNHPLLQHENVIATPHLGASTKEAQVNVASQVANEICLFFKGKSVKNAINLSSLTDEILEKLKPYHSLAKKMGVLLSQQVQEPVQEIEMTYSGVVANLETAYVTKAMVSGFLQNRMANYINEVNAFVIAKERGISLVEKNTDQSYGYSNCLTVTIKGEKSVYYLRGTYIEYYGPRIVNLNGFNIDFLPEGNLLYLQHMDRPGVIGKVGKILGDHEVNIATMQVGRKELGGEAIMVLSFDEPVKEEITNKLKLIEDIISIQVFNL